MSDLVIINEFLRRHEAEMAKGLLENEGIKVSLTADDCGGAYPGMSFGSTIKLSIEKSDVEKAKEILKMFEQPE